MKLLQCQNCHAVFSLSSKQQSCPGCGKCGGYYTDNINAIWWGEATPLGFSNPSFVNALCDQPRTSPGKRFVAFVIEKNCPTFKKIIIKNSFFCQKSLDKE